MKEEKEEKIELVVFEGNLMNMATGEVFLSGDDISDVANAEVVLLGDKENLAIGLAVPTAMSQPVDYLYNMDEYKLTKNASVDKRMEVCENMYTYEGIVGSVIDLYVDMATTELMMNDVGNDDAKIIFDFFNTKLNRELETASSGINSFIARGMKQYLVYGNAFPYKTYKSVKDEVSSKSFQLPINIMYLNPKAIKIDEKKVLIGIEEISIVGSGGVEKSGKVISKDKINHIKRASNDWVAFGTPFLLRAFNSVASKKRLRRLDDTTIEGLINYLTIFKLGSPDKDSPFHKPSMARLRAFANLIKGPTASTTLIWTHDISVETAGPDGKVLDFKEKYKSANSDILESLGIGASILTGKTDDTATLILIETLETMREDFIEYLTRLYEEIFEKNNIKLNNPLKLSFANISVADTLTKLKNLILTYYDRGLISIETALTMGGYDFKSEIDRQTAQVPLKEKGLFGIPNLPFSTQKEEVNSPSTRDDGRPSNSTKPVKTTPENEVKLDKPETQKGYQMSEADDIFVENYLTGLNHYYQGILDSLLKKIDNSDPYIFDNASISISAGFMNFRKHASAALKVAYDTFNLDEPVDEKDFMYQKLANWNDMYITSFQRDITKSALSVIMAFKDSDIDLVTSLIIQLFDRHRQRLQAYANEGFNKARVAGGLEVARKTGYIGGYWQTSGDDKVCDVCDAREGNWYTLDELFALQPSHVNCRCDAEMTTENPYLTQQGHNNEVVITKPKSPNKKI